MSVAGRLEVRKSRISSRQSAIIEPAELPEPSHLYERWPTRKSHAAKQQQRGRLSHLNHHKFAGVAQAASSASDDTRRQRNLKLAEHNKRMRQFLEERLVQSTHVCSATNLEGHL